ncbi:septation inhibitor protein [Geobacillus sp. 46C-IIa]|uniref:FtsB family cell division protein n=1 Tax=Geobacillus sp. 46C-IIa TaxID=1963025 RepID=UPI0009C059B0|nr:septum formation initiator family protein [Geobacillus sp. 46C-IIa]OQP04397.1 septation inhibitor protein [Geobacillus sp. 46C-IIa]QNU27838.1 septum formation initiator family protein [Geobacillus sp. 46C-IIa]
MNVPRKPNVTKIQSTYVSEQEEKKRKTSKRRRVVAVRLAFWASLFTVFASALLYALHLQAKTIDGKTAEKQRLKEELAKLERQEKQLKEEMKKLHDDDYIAELARKKYYLSKDGEIIFVLPEK